MKRDLDVAQLGAAVGHAEHLEGRLQRRRSLPKECEFRNAHPSVAKTDRSIQRHRRIFRICFTSALAHPELDGEGVTQPRSQDLHVLEHQDWSSESHARHQWLEVEKRLQVAGKDRRVTPPCRRRRRGDFRRRHLEMKGRRKDCVDLKRT
eukprot:scaffold8234_cov248-Pinguiococcus_pyrenoidosus.AAC.4